MLKLSSFSERRVEKLAEGVYALSGIPGECRMYVVEGSDRALLIDTGLGLGNIREEVERIVGDKPIIAVNTHGHGDHAGGNVLFDRVYAAEAAKPDALMALELNKSMLDERLWPPLKEAAARAVTEYVPLAEGMTLELGDRGIEVIDIPGHTAGCAAFLDGRSGLAFTGDCVLFSMHILLFVPTSLTVARYLESMKKLAERLRGFRGMCTGHDEGIMPLDSIDEAIALASGIVDGSVPGEAAVLPKEWPETDHRIRRARGKRVTIDYRPAKVK